MDIFNHRELALGIWICIGAVFIISEKPVRESLINVWRVLCSKYILISFALMVGYIVLAVGFLSKIDFWDFGQLKNTILWGVSVAIVSVYRSMQLIEEENYFREIIKDNFKIIVALEFLITFYTFSFWIEFIIVPMMAFLALIYAYAETNEEYEPIRKFAGILLTLWGICLAIYTFYKLVVDFEVFARPETVTDFFLPIILSLMFLPFLYVIALYAIYERTYIRLNFIIKDDPLRRSAKRKAFAQFHVRTRQMKQWFNNIKLVPPCNQQELEASIKRIKTPQPTEEQNDLGNRSEA